MKRPRRFKPVNRHLWLLLPILVSYGADIIFTARGQSPSYWGGNYADVRELNPAWHWYLSIGPWAYFTFHVVQFALLSLILVRLSVTLAKMLAVYWTLSSLTGAYTWIQFSSHWMGEIPLIILAGILVCAVARADAPAEKTYGKWRIAQGWPNHGLRRQ